MLVKKIKENGRYYMRKAGIIEHIDYFIIRHITWLLPLIIVFNILFAVLIIRSM